MGALSGCYYDQSSELYPAGAGACDSTAFSYTSDISPIITNNCLNCHSASLAQGGVNLEGFDNLQTYAQNGRLLGSVTHASGYFPMPLGAPKLSDCDLAKIRQWVNNGVLNN